MKTLLKSILTILVFSQTLIIAQDGPLVAAEGEKKVITSGYGKNPDEALTQALRNAVEEAVGTYMTSTTRIENDDIIEDKILSLSRGFIKDFKKLSEMKVEGETKVTVAVIVTKTQILETLKASGVKVEIKGGLLFAQVSQEKEQMEDEANIIREYTKNIPQEHPFDYSLEYGTPVPQSDTRFKIPLKIKVSVNQNYHNQYANLKSFLNEIAVEETNMTKEYPKQITEAEIEKIQQRYGTYLSREYSDIFKNSSFSPYAVMLYENQGEIAYRLLNEHSIKSLETLMINYFTNLRFTIIAQSTTKSTIPVNIFLTSPIKEINEGGFIRLEGNIGYEYKSRLQKNNIDIDKDRRIDRVDYKTVNLNDGHILNKEFLTLSFNLYIEETFMQSLTSLEVLPPTPITWTVGPVTDIDGNSYKTIRIGQQVWMAENLKVTHYRDGTEIPNVHSYYAWKHLSTGAWAVYYNDPANADTYGYLYNWFAVDDSRNIAPEGWHVPTDEEWKRLEIYLGVNPKNLMPHTVNNDYRATNEGSKLAGNSDLWNDGELENNSEFGTSGFTALPGGFRYTYLTRNYEDRGYYGYFWSSDESGAHPAWARKLSYGHSGVLRNSRSKSQGLSVRCVRD